MVLPIAFCRLFGTGVHWRSAPSTYTFDYKWWAHPGPVPDILGFSYKLTTLYSVGLPCLVRPPVAYLPLFGLFGSISFGTPPLTFFLTLVARLGHLRFSFCGAMTAV